MAKLTKFGTNFGTIKHLKRLFKKLFYVIVRVNYIFEFADINIFDEKFAAFYCFILQIVSKTNDCVSYVQYYVYLTDQNIAFKKYSTNYNWEQFIQKCHWVYYMNLDLNNFNFLVNSFEKIIKTTREKPWQRWRSGTFKLNKENTQLQAFFWKSREIVSNSYFSENIRIVTAVVPAIISAFKIGD